MLNIKQFQWMSTLNFHLWSECHVILSRPGKELVWSRLLRENV